MNKEKSKKIANSQFIILEEMKNINIPFDSLKPLEPAIDIVSMFQRFKEILSEKNSDWTLQIGVINYLRRVHKFDKSAFYQFFYGAKIYQKLVELIFSVRSSVSKNVLLFLKEIISENIPENKNSILALIKTVLPLLIQKISSNQSFIKAECKQLLETISKNVKFPEILLLILQKMIDIKRTSGIPSPNSRNKDNDSEILSSFFINSAKNLGKNILLDFPSFQEIIKSLVSFYDLNRSRNVKFCKNILNCLIEVMDKENFEAKLEKYGKKERDGVASIINEKIGDNHKKMRGSVSSIHFRKNLQDRKKSLKLSKSNNISFDKGNKSATIKFTAKNKKTMVGDKKHNLSLQHNDENIQKNN